MKKVYIDCFLQNGKVDEMLMSVLKKFPDEAFEPLMEIKERKFDNGAMWATLQIQELCRKYLSDDRELMKLLDEDKGNVPAGGNGNE